MNVLRIIAGPMLVAFAAGLGMPAAAQNTFDLPAGCEAYASAQLRSCEVMHFFRCENDPSGHQQSATFDQTGMTFVSRIDTQTQWIESFSLRSGIQENLEETPIDPANFDELLETGIDTFDFKTQSPQVGATHFTGFDQLTGRSITIDGVELLETENNVTAYGNDGNILWQAQGNEYIHPTWRRFFPGTAAVTADGNTFDTDESPVEFDFPGDPGFLSVNPKFGCDAVMSRAPSQLDSKEMPHDHL